MSEKNFVEKLQTKILELENTIKKIETEKDDLHAKNQTLNEDLRFVKIQI